MGDAGADAGEEGPSRKPRIHVDLHRVTSAKWGCGFGSRATGRGPGRTGRRSRS
jgi:hypothetical protein